MKYIKWNWTTRHRNGFLISTRTFLKPNKNEPIVESFMLNAKPEKYTTEIITTGEYKKLSELINYLKDKEDKTKNINEQTFELIPNA